MIYFVLLLITFRHSKICRLVLVELSGSRSSALEPKMISLCNSPHVGIGGKTNSARRALPPIFSTLILFHHRKIHLHLSIFIITTTISIYQVRGSRMERGSTTKRFGRQIGEVGRVGGGSSSNKIKSQIIRTIKDSRSRFKNRSSWCLQVGK